MVLRLRIRKMENGEYYLKFWWHFWEDVHLKYFPTKQQLITYLESLITDTNDKAMR